MNFRHDDKLEEVNLTYKTIYKTQLPEYALVFGTESCNSASACPLNFIPSQADIASKTANCLNWTNLFLWETLHQAMPTHEIEYAYCQILLIKTIDDTTLAKIKEIALKVDSVFANQLNAVKTYSDLHTIQRQIQGRRKPSSVHGSIVRVEVKLDEKLSQLESKLIETMNANVARIEAKLSEIESKVSRIEAKQCHFESTLNSIEMNIYKLMEICKNK